MEKITTCERCRHMVSSQDVICPYCGNKLKQKKNERTKKTEKRSGSNLLYIIALAPLILVMSGVCGFYLLSDDEKPQWLLEWNSSHTTEPAQTEETVGTEEPAQTQTPDETGESGAAPASEQPAAAEPAPEPTPEPTPEPPPEPTPEPTVKQAYSTPDKYGHSGKIPPIFTEYTSSSAEEDVYSVLCAFDKSMDTVWGTGGENGGINEWVMISSNEYQVVSGVRIFNGNTKNEEAFKDNARVKIVELSFSDGSYEKRILQDGFSRNEPYIIRLKEPINTKYVKITVLDKYGTSDMVCIGEIEVF